MGIYYLAIDIGASSGRHILGHLEDGKIMLEEIYRFENGMVKKNGHLCWDIDSLYKEIKAGIKKCKEIGKVPVTMGIDTWAVDYVLLDKEGKALGDAIGYRDKRTQGMDNKVYETISLDKLYGRTGIQKQIFNTIYQLTALKETQPQLLEQAQDLLMIPDYFHYLLTGNKIQEYTNATTTQLVSPDTKDWDYELIDMLGLKKEIFKEIAMPGTLVGTFTPELEEEVGFTCKVVLPATHDTGSAVLAVPADNDDFLYISSGTWSLMGIESKAADCTLESMQKNFTNEGGYEYRFRYLKNIMGLWMIQSARHEWKDAYSFAQICEMAEEEKAFPSRVDVNNDCFLAPDSMIEAIKEYCRSTDQQVPETVGQIATCIYQSLAESYAQTAEEIEQLRGTKYSRIYIVGGGSNADYLNKLTAQKTKKEVYAGPGEATAIGNIVAQMLQEKEFTNVYEARKCIFNSFDIKKF